MKVKIKEILGIYESLIPESGNEVKNFEMDETEVAKAFSIALKAVRKYKKISLQALAEQIDIPNPTISRYENGLVVPTLPQVIKIAYFFELPISLFILLGAMGLVGADNDYLGEIYGNVIDRMNEAKAQQRKPNREQRRHAQRKR